MLSFKSAITVYLYLKHMVWKHTVYLVNKFDICHTPLKQKKKKNAQTAFVSPSKNNDEKEEEKKNTGSCKAFCVTRVCM